MATPLIDMAASVTCPHGGKVTLTTTNARVRVGGTFAILAPDIGAVAGCAFFIGPTPMPCVTSRFLTPAARVRVMGQPVLLMTTTGICEAATRAPQGPPMIIHTQVRVRGI